MNFRTERCPVGDTVVTLVSDFEGTITMVICPDYDYVNSACARRRLGDHSAPLNAFYNRISGHAGDAPLARCVYGANAAA